MRNPFRTGATKTVTVCVTEERLARFEGQVVHPAYSTFALGQDAEWTCRQFVLEMIEPGEEGVGSFLSIYHTAPAVLGDEVAITATLQHVTGNEVHCTWVAYVHVAHAQEQRRIGHGEQTQRIIQKTRFEKLLAQLAAHDK